MLRASKKYMTRNRNLLNSIAGCVYENNKYKNACTVITFDLNEEGHVVGAEFWFRGCRPAASVQRRLDL